MDLSLLQEATYVSAVGPSLIGPFRTGNRAQALALWLLLALRVYYVQFLQFD